MREAEFILGGAITPKADDVQKGQRELLEELKREAVAVGFEVRDEPKHGLIVIIDPASKQHGVVVGFDDDGCFVTSDNDRRNHTYVEIEYHTSLARYVGKEWDTRAPYEGQIRERRSAVAVLAEGVVARLTTMRAK